MYLQSHNVYHILKYIGREGKKNQRIQLNTCTVSMALVLARMAFTEIETELAGGSLSREACKDSDLSRRPLHMSSCMWKCFTSSGVVLQCLFSLPLILYPRGRGGSDPQKQWNCAGTEPH